MRMELLETLLANAKATKMAWDTIPVNVSLTTAEMRWLVNAGCSWTTDRLMRPMLGYSQRARQEDLRRAVLAKRAERERR